MTDFPQFVEFRVECAREGLVHLVFDMPGRTMNVFSNAAIHELGLFAAWLKQADVRGVVIRSGKDSAFCAGADLGELGAAYDMIVAARPEDRFDIAFDHFFPLSKAIRALETAGKPVAVAIAGLALGGGCELALGGHYRVLVDDPRVAMGLPESLVGLLPGGGGTQRLPRLIGVAAALPILLEAGRLWGQAAIDAGIAHALARPGEEVSLAEDWILSGGQAIQPWDLAGYAPALYDDIAPVIATERAKQLRETRGHYPAPLAILDCIEQGYVQSFDAAIRTEMSIFALLIKRPEPRNMIQTMFLGKTDYERAMRKGAVSKGVQDAVSALGAKIDTIVAEVPELAAAGFGGQSGEPLQIRAGHDYWINGTAAGASAAKAKVVALGEAAAPFLALLSLTEQRMADYALVTQHGFPAYLGGPLAIAATK
jgi:3-hydroxyacyl-CoA dehydrogenase/enoyl-CoA hydratase/3-hydroxybutyryl-CoA epimerase